MCVEYFFILREERSLIPKTRKKNNKTKVKVRYLTVKKRNFH